MVGKTKKWCKIEVINSHINFCSPDCVVTGHMPYHLSLCSVSCLQPGRKCVTRSPAMGNFPGRVSSYCTGSWLEVVRNELRPIVEWVKAWFLTDWREKCRSSAQAPFRIQAGYLLDQDCRWRRASQDWSIIFEVRFLLTGNYQSWKARNCTETGE